MTAQVLMATGTRPPSADRALPGTAGPDIVAIATAFAESLRAGTCPPDAVPAADPVWRTATLARRTADYDVWVLRWPQGTRVDPHDHGGSAGAFCVVTGELLEVRWEGGVESIRRVRPSSPVSVGPGVVHDVVGATRAALSVHVYAPPLSTMGFYDDSGTRLLHVEDVDDDAPAAGRRCASGMPAGRDAIAAGAARS